MVNYTTCGKQVLRDGHDYAQAITPGAAERIAQALNDTDTPPGAVMRELIARDEPGPLFERSVLPPCPDGRDAYLHQILENGKHHVRQESDEYACSCGVRWDVSDGEAHP